MLSFRVRIFSSVVVVYRSHMLVFSCSNSFINIQPYTLDVRFFMWLTQQLFMVDACIVLICSLV